MLSVIYDENHIQAFMQSVVKLSVVAQYFSVRSLAWFQLAYLGVYQIGMLLALNKTDLKVTTNICFTYFEYIVVKVFLLSNDFILIH
jgi:hypothetical protein